MSEATLKRKTFAKYNNNSVGTIFSLNGTLRSQGWVGQDTLGRSLPKASTKGSVVRGTYQQKDIAISAITSLNDPSVIKSSSLDNKGMIRTKYRWLWRPQPYSTTKEDTTRTILSQSEYITGKSTNIVNNIIDISYSNISSLACCKNLPKEARSKPIINPQHVQTRYPGNYTKTNITRPERNNPIMGILGGNYVNVILNQSTYVSYLNTGCNGVIQDISLNANCSQIRKQQDTLKTPLIGGTRTY